MEPQKISQVLSREVSVNYNEAYSEIELTEEETAIALMEARRVKAAKIASMQYKEKLAKGPEYKFYTAEELYEKASKQFTFDEFNKQIIWELCQYFTGDDRTKLNPYKGILLYGPIGCGKTAIMNFFRHNQTNSFQIVSCADIAKDYAKDGHVAIYRFKNSIPSNDKHLTYGQQDIGVCFDDMGTEVEKKHYGNEANVMAEIIFSRYPNKGLHSKTHFTTNCNIEVLTERYGDRVRSRLREMVNVVTFADSAPDRRK